MIVYQDPTKPTRILSIPNRNIGCIAIQPASTDSSKTEVKIYGLQFQGLKEYLFEHQSQAELFYEELQNAIRDNHDYLHKLEHIYDIDKFYNDVKTNAAI